MPFDQFTIEQLAGDLLPNATDSQKIATGFHRNSMVNLESGTVIEQYRVAAVVDRVNTTMTVWMGTTIGCAQCHTHKFDPISQTEYYQLFAFFNNTEEEVVAERFNRLFVGPRITVAQPVERTALVMVKRNDSRATHVLRRGSYLQPGEQVTARVPEAWHTWPTGQPLNRLGLAQWLMHPDNPLAARVAANRIWTQLMGQPLVETVNDFGSQGALPTHPDLLDFLATDFLRGGWSRKAMDRLIVTSTVYKQVSHATVEAMASDPDNRHYGRASSFRLDAETIRDNALIISGLLNHALGGQSIKLVRPPAFDLEEPEADDAWTPADGPARFRRGIYAYIKRMMPHPTPTVLDAPMRDRCVARRARTNTPLQALTLLNDPAFVECAVAFSLSAADRGRW